MRIRILFHSLFAVCLLLNGAVAGDSPAALPKGALLGLSIRSPNALLEAVDAAAVTVTRKTAKPLAPNIIKVLVQLYGVIPPMRLENWDCDKELLVLFPGEKIDRKDYAFVFAVTDYAGLIENIADIFDKPERDETVDASTVSIPNMGKFLVAALGDSHAVAAVSPAGLQCVRDAWRSGWRPRHWGRGVVGARFVFPDGWWLASPILSDLDGLAEKTLELLQNERDAILESETFHETGLGAAGDTLLDNDIAMGMGDALRTCIPAFERELDGLRGLALDIDLDGDEFALDLAVDAADGTLLHAMAANAAARDNLDAAPAGAMADNPLAVAMNAPLAEAIPDFAPVMARMARLTVGRVFPDRMDEYGDMARDFVVYNMDRSVGVLHPAADTLHFTLRTNTPDPARAKSTLLRSLELSNEIADASMATAYQPYAKYTIAEYPVPGLDDCAAIRFDQDSVAQAMRRLGRPELAPTIRAVFLTYRSLAATGDGALGVATGFDGEMALVASLATALTGGERSAAADALAAAADRLSARQNALILFRFDDLVFRLIVFSKKLEQSAMPGNPLTNFFLKTLEQARERFRTSDAFAAAAIGAADGSMVAGLRIPLDSVNALYGNWLHFTKTRDAIFAKARKRPGRKEDKNAAPAPENAPKPEDVGVYGEDGF